MRKIFSAALALVCIWFATPAHAALPSGYTQLEYIESERGAYIDTGITYGKFVHDIQFIIDGQRNLQGNGVSDSMFWEATDADRFKFSSASNGYILGNPANRNIVEFYMSSSEASLTIGNNTITHTHGSINKTYLLFALNGSTMYSALAKLYSLKVYNNSDVLIQDLVPAKRNSDGAIGLYDTVSGEFFENKGEGTFVAGPVVEIKIATTKYVETQFSDLGTRLAAAVATVNTVVSNTITQAGRIATLQAQKQTRPNDIADDNEKCPAGKKCLLVEDANGVPHWYEIVESYSRLPEGFTELQYIQSSGSQYIDTGVKGNMGVKFDVDFAVSDSSVTNFIVASRAQSGAATRFYLCTFFNSGHGVFDIALGDDEFAGTVQNNTRYTAVVDTNVAPSTLVISDGTTLSSSGNYNTDLNLYVFASNTAGTANFGGKKPITIYKLKIYENNTLVRDFVPAKNADGKIGMYDLANGVFYENAGEGSFIAGDPVAE